MRGGADAPSPAREDTQRGVGVVAKRDLLAFARRRVKEDMEGGGGADDDDDDVREDVGGVRGRECRDVVRGAEDWSALRSGEAALACARAAFPESYEACVGKATSVSGRVRHPWECVRRIFSREKVPASALSYEKMQSGTDFASTHDAFAMMFWVWTLRKRYREGSSALNGVECMMSFAHKLSGAIVEYCTSAETRLRVERLARRAMKLQKTHASASSIPWEDVETNENLVNTDRPGNATTEKVEHARVSGRTATSHARRVSMSIDDWEALTELRWELEKTKETLEERERELEKLRSHQSSPRAARVLEMKISDLVDQLALEHEAHARTSQLFETEMKTVRLKLAAIMKVVLSPENMGVFNAVDVGSEEGRAVAQTMIDLMDRISKSREQDSPVFARNMAETSPIIADTSDELSNSFLSRLDSLELSSDSASMAKLDATSRRFAS